MEADDFVNNLKKLGWACRRGMLELDVLLGNFLQERYQQLTLDEKKMFVKLLACSDPELFAWLLGSEIPTDKELAHIITLIRKHAQSRI